MPPHLKYILLALVFAALLILRINFLLAQEAAWTLPYYAGTTAVVSGIVAEDPDVRDTSTRVAVEVETLNGQAAAGKLLASLPPATQVAYGDQVGLRGFVELPQAFETNPGRLFDYPGYLRVRGVSAVMQHAALRADTPSGTSLFGFLFFVKHTFEQSLQKVLPQPQAALLEGILLGERGGLSNALLQVFVVVGLIHVVVLSGSNISIVAEGVFRILSSFLPRRAAYVAGAAAMVLFVLMTGSGAASVRALIMGGVAIVARLLRRQVLALRALAAAVAFMLLWNPLSVLDSGFVLSVLATFGLITIAPAIEKHLTPVPNWRRFNLRSIVATTLAVEVFILPALLYYSGVLSVISVPANALILPVVPLVMFAGFITGMLGLVHPALAFLPGFITDILLRLIVWLAQSAAALPFAATVVAPFPAWVAVLVYVPLTVLALRTYAKSNLTSRT